MKSLTLVQHLKAPLDHNGNSQRLWMVTRIKPETDEITAADYAKGDMRQTPRSVIVRCFDEQGRGMDCIDVRSETDYHLPPVNITATEYRRLKKQFSYYRDPLSIS